MKKRKKLYSKSAIIYSASITFVVVVIIDLLLLTLVRYAPYNLMPEHSAPLIVGTLVTLVLFALVFLIIFLILNPLLKALNKLIISMQKVADGNFSTRLKGKTPTFFKSTFDNFNKMAAELNSTEMLKEDFVAQFSHEFKTPVSSINGFAKLLTDKSVSAEKKQEYAEIIAEESERLSKLSGQVMLLTNIENQHVITKKKKLKVDEQLRKTLISLLPKIEEKNLNYELNLEKTLYCTNPELLREVWINLLNNSIKFTPEGGTVFVSCRSQKNQIEVVIGNNGPEINEEEKKKIFDKFYQADTKVKNQGLGLGLAIVNKILTLMKGKIEILSVYKNVTGAFFVIKLPK